VHKRGAARASIRTLSRKSAGGKVVTSSGCIALQKNLLDLTGAGRRLARRRPAQAVQSSATRARITIVMQGDVLACAMRVAAIVGGRAIGPIRRVSAS
jgi:hypothetical protein